MKQSDQQIDSSMKAYAKKWMKSLNKPRPSTTLGYFFAGLFVLFWSSSIAKLLGYDPSKLSGGLIFIAILFVLVFIMWLLVRILAIIGVNRSTRSAVILSALIGPYVYMAIDQHWNSAVISHIAGFIASVISFLISLILDQTLEQKSAK